MIKMAELKVGDSLPTIEKKIDQERIMAWADISGDFNRLHVDEEYARQTNFGGTIAHGPLSLAYLNELMMNVFGRNWITGGRLLNVRFVSPTRPGDTIRISGTVKELEQEEDTIRLHCDLFIEKGPGEKTVISECVCIVPKGG